MSIRVVSSPSFCNAIITPTCGKHKIATLELSSAKFQFRHHKKIGVRCPKLPSRISYSSSQNDGDEEHQNSLEELSVPSDWLEPSRAAQESEWLRATLHKWLDDEYCPEATNIEISKVAADSFYKSLMEKRVDLGEILLKMAVELESISYQESFHGAFSSANAAVNLIVQRLLEE